MQFIMKLCHVLAATLLASVTGAVPTVRIFHDHLLYLWLINVPLSGCYQPVGYHSRPQD